MTISAKVLKVLTTEHISPAELQHMLRDASFTSLRGCNRRYFQWLFLLKDGQLTDMQRVELVEIGHGQNRMLENHERCKGDGCRECGWSGLVSRSVGNSTPSHATH